MKIQRLRIDLTPTEFAYGFPQLSVRVRADGIDFTCNMPLPDDDLDSRFDFLFDRAKRMIREALEKSAAASAGQQTEVGR